MKDSNKSILKTTQAISDMTGARATAKEELQVAKDAREAMQECVSEFISFITSEASDKCLQEKRKTINGDDILWAMGALGFDKYIEPLKMYLQKFL